MTMLPSDSRGMNSEPMVAPISPPAASRTTVPASTSRRRATAKCTTGR